MRPAHKREKQGRDSREGGQKDGSSQSTYGEPAVFIRRENVARVQGQAIHPVVRVPPRTLIRYQNVGLNFNLWAYISRAAK